MERYTLTAAKFANLALLGLFPVAWTAPLASVEIAWLFQTTPITVASGVVELYETDAALSILVALLAIAIPYVKTLLLVYAQFSDTDTARAVLPLLEALARLSMTDVFLIAFYIIAYRGVGELQVEWGLYLFTALVLISIWASWETKRRRFVTRPRKADDG